MKKKLNYREAFQKLNKLLEEVQNNDVPVDDLLSKVKEARSLVAYCQDILRQTEEALEQNEEE